MAPEVARQAPQQAHKHGPADDAVLDTDFGGLSKATVIGGLRYR